MVTEGQRFLGVVRIELILNIPILSHKVADTAKLSKGCVVEFSKAEQINGVNGV